MLRFPILIAFVSLLSPPVFAAPTPQFPPVFTGTNGKGERLELARCGTKWRLLYQVNRARPVEDLPDLVEAQVQLTDGIWSAHFALRSWQSEVAVVLEKQRPTKEKSDFDWLCLKGNAAVIGYYRISQRAIATPFRLTRVRRSARIQRRFHKK